jgi:hypothetical protein
MNTAEWLYLEYQTLNSRQPHTSALVFYLKKKKKKSETTPRLYVFHQRSESEANIHSSRN